mgnify:CR=1 FL=1
MEGGQAAPEETKLCEHCNKPIAVAKLRLHVVGCLRARKQREQEEAEERAEREREAAE